MFNRFRLNTLFLFVFTVFFLNRPLSSEEKKFTQIIEWKADKSAYEYRIELKSGEKSTMYTTDKTSIELHLQAGKYSYRIFVYDFLGRQATVSEWKSFEIVKASTPKISLDESESITADEEGNIELAIDIANISANSVIELVSDSIVGSFVIEGNKKSVSEVEKVSKVQFANVPAGKWKIRVTNPSGLSSESEDTITVIEKPVVSAEEPSENAATEDTEKTETVSDEQSEITDESEDKEEEKEIAEEETKEEPQIAETEEEQPDTFTKQPEPVAEKKKKAKTPKPPKPPYICKDITRSNNEIEKFRDQERNNDFDRDKLFNMISTSGIFILVSTRQLPTTEILPTYYSRQQVEQLFDIEKNYSNLVPLRVQTEETLRGHLLLVFIVSALIKMLQEDLRDTEDTPMNLFLNLRNQKCKVYNTTIITAEPVKKVNDIYKKFYITCPPKFRLNGNQIEGDTRFVKQNKRKRP